MTMIAPEKEIKRRIFNVIRDLIFLEMLSLPGIPRACALSSIKQLRKAMEKEFDIICPGWSRPGELK